MSYEFDGIPSATLTDDVIRKVTEYVVPRSPDYVVVRADGDQIGFGKRCGSMQFGPELVTLVMTERRVYVAFHSDTRSERNAFIGLIVESLAHQNIKCEFAEL